MGVTAIKTFRNMTSKPVRVTNVERGHTRIIPSEHTQDFDIWIPWCNHQVDFDWNHYMMIEVESTNKSFWIWNSN